MVPVGSHRVERRAEVLVPCISEGVPPAPGRVPLATDDEGARVPGGRHQNREQHQQLHGRKLVRFGDIRGLWSMGVIKSCNNIQCIKT